MRKVSKKIKEIRKTNNLSQEELAKLIGVSRNSVQSWEIGRHDLKGYELIKLSRLFKVSVNFLLGVDDEDSSKK